MACSSLMRESVPHAKLLYHPQPPLRGKPVSVFFQYILLYIFQYNALRQMGCADTFPGARQLR